MFRLIIVNRNKVFVKILLLQSISTVQFLEWILVLNFDMWNEMQTMPDWTDQQYLCNNANMHYANYFELNVIT